MSFPTRSTFGFQDFDGDGFADLFLATGAHWFYAPAGRNWTCFADSGYRTKELRFGDFNGDHRTDVLGVVGGAWQIVPGGTASWTFWRDLHFNYAPGGRNPVARLSRQMMR